MLFAQFCGVQPSCESALPEAAVAAPATSAALPTAVRVETAAMRAVVAAVCGLLVAMPFLAVRFPPVTDLPQHVAQVRLFLAALADPDGLYRIQWLTPYSAVYALLGGAWALSTPADAGRFAMIGLAVLWTAAAHGLAAYRQRAVGAAILASLLFWNHTVYWGFLSFVFGWPVFAVWVALTCRPARERWSAATYIQYGGLAVVLYVSHALWFAAAVAWLLVIGVLHRLAWPEQARRLACVAPVMIVAALWYPHLAAGGFQSDTVWVTDPTARLSFSWLTASILGGLRGSSEPLVLAAAVGWLGFGLWQHRTVPGRGIDRDLLAAGLMLALFGVLLPDKHMNTIQFAARWMPSAAILLVLALPAPVVMQRRSPALALAVVAAFSVVTSAAWQRVEREELSGLPEALERLPDGAPRVIGLDFIKTSSVIEGRPFLQTFAYAQVLRGGTMNFSFASFAPSLVVFRERRRTAWTPALEWLAERVTRRDFEFFDYAVVNATDEQHRRLASEMGLTPATAAGRWRLYRTAAATP